MAFKNFISVLCVYLALASYSANATLILNVENDQLVGARNVDVNGVLYDVTFRDGTFSSIFGGTTGLDATDASQADVFSNAIIDQLFTGAFARNPSAIFGCDRLSSCSVSTPYDISVAFRSAVNFTDLDSSLGYGYTLQTSDLSQIYFDHLVWADWSQASVPEPSVLGLLVFGLIGFAKRKKT